MEPEAAASFASPSIDPCPQLLSGKNTTEISRKKTRKLSCYVKRPRSLPAMMAQMTYTLQTEYELILKKKKNHYLKIKF